jgi:hypothetical protein
MLPPGVVDDYLSQSFAAPHQFGHELEAFVADARELLLAASPNGRFWDWPGDTWILVATRPRRSGDRQAANGRQRVTASRSARRHASPRSQRRRRRAPDLAPNVNTD